MSSERSGNGAALRVVLDSNILVSALLHPQRNAGILLQMVVAGRIAAYISPEIDDELREVFERFSLGMVFWERHRQHFRVVSPSYHLAVCRDPSDDKFIECAVAAGADFIISGDRALLDVAAYRGIRILTVTEFLEME